MTATAIANPDSVVARIVADLKQNPEAKNLLLRTLLTDELLALPTRVDRIEERLDALTAQVAENSRQIALLIEQVAALTHRVDALTEQVTENSRQIALLIEQVAALTPKVGTMDSTLGNLVGDNLERKVHSNIRNILFQRLPFRFRVRKVLQSITVDSDTALTEALYDAADADRIADSALIGAFAADIILAGRLQGESSDIYLVAEVSRTINNDDITRACERARTISAVMGSEAIAAAIGGIAAPPQIRLAEELDVHIIIDPQLLESRLQQ